jgi:hypothetical protein
MASETTPTLGALRKLADSVLADPDTWMETENLDLGGKKPIVLIQEGKGEQVKYLLQAIKHGIPT